MAKEPATSMSWDEVHRLELHLRASSDGLGRCPGCGQVVEDGQGGIELGGVAVHLGCLPTLRRAPQSA